MLERRVFQKIMVRSGRQEQEDNIRFLSSVPLLQGIHAIELAKIAEFLKRVSGKQLFIVITFVIWTPSNSINLSCF